MLSLLKKSASEPKEQCQPKAEMSGFTILSAASLHLPRETKPLFLSQIQKKYGPLWMKLPLLSKSEGCA
jgi:hypothetical protein